MDIHIENHLHVCIVRNNDELVFDHKVCFKNINEKISSNYVSQIFGIVQRTC